MWCCPPTPDASSTVSYTHLYEPRIKLINLQIDSPDPNEGSLRVLLEYEIRSTNSRFNLVFPFYRTDANEVLGSVSGAA